MQKGRGKKMLIKSKGSTKVREVRERLWSRYFLLLVEDLCWSRYS